jgi:glycosyltransferase involved in cell wall biosynthesis
MRLEITPLLLTFNERENIVRTLERLSWAHSILVIDSGSTDETCELARTNPRVRIVHRPFTSFADQCNFGLTQISTPWVLSMDADYVLSRN